MINVEVLMSVIIEEMREAVKVVEVVVAMILMYVVMIMIMSGHDALTASKWGSAYTEYS